VSTYLVWCHSREETELDALPHEAEGAEQAANSWGWDKQGGMDEFFDLTVKAPDGSESKWRTRVDVQTSVDSERLPDPNPEDNE